MELFRLSKPGWLVGAAVVLWATAGAAGAAPCVGTSVGSASTDDVNLGGFEADKCVVSIVNAQEGPNGNTSGFDGTFGGGWSLLTKYWGDDGSQHAATFDGVSFRISFKTNANRISGTWGLATKTSATFDFVFAMHASDRSGAFLFENEPTAAGATKSGNWRIEWLNESGRVPAYSNLTLFVRNYKLEAPGSEGAPPAGAPPAGAPPAAVQTVPEPATGLLILSGLVAVAGTRRRRH